MRIALLISIPLIAAIAASAGVPPMINYQGKLRFHIDSIDYQENTSTPGVTISNYGTTVRFDTGSNYLMGGGAN